MVATLWRVRRLPSSTGSRMIHRFVLVALDAFLAFFTDKNILALHEWNITGAF